LQKLLAIRSVVNVNNDVVHEFLLALSWLKNRKINALRRWQPDANGYDDQPTSQSPEHRR
jgi:hypothetical protein